MKQLNGWDKIIKQQIFILYTEKKELESAKEILKQIGFVNSKVAPLNKKIRIE